MHNVNELEAQLRAVRRLRQGDPATAAPRRREGLSQVDMAFDILNKARSLLHTKKVARGDRFLRPEKNTFALRPEARSACWPRSSPSFRTGAASFPNSARSSAAYDRRSVH
jgi:hypothetical protein